MFGLQDTNTTTWLSSLVSELDQANADDLCSVIQRGDTMLQKIGCDFNDGKGGSIPVGSAIF